MESISRNRGLDFLCTKRSGEGSGLTFYIGLMSGMSILRPDLKAFLIRG